MGQHWLASSIYSTKEAILCTEAWREIAYPFDCYEVSDQGRVRRRTNAPGTYAGRLMTQSLSREGYPQVCMCPHSSRSVWQMVHRLVAKTFIGPRPNNKEVNHRDGVKSHNYVSNLEYVTTQENNAHAARLGLKARGSNASRAKLNEQQVLEIRMLLDQGWHKATLATAYTVTISAIHHIKMRYNWRHI
jgi:hypothetical protein